MAGSGYRKPPALARRADGQTIQLTPLLYAVLEAVDGERDAHDVARVVSERTGRTVSADNVHALVRRLRPLGLLTRPDGTEPVLKRSDPLLGLRFKYAVTDPVWTRRLTAPFAVLFQPLLALPLLAAFGVVCWWVFLEQGLAHAAYEAFEHPGLMLLVFGVTVLSAWFHEFGHAAAARYGGATPGVMGIGLYLVWPAFYTDVTDSYRLGRWGRVRTDLGGLYFNAIVAVAITGAWWLTGYEALLLVVATQILQMVRQLTPLVRFDGYHVLADVTGVPDLFHRIKPTLLGVLPWRWGDPEARLLKPWARAVVTLWVVVVVPVLVVTLASVVLILPRIVGTAWVRLQEEQHRLAAVWSAGDQVSAAAVVLTMLATALPVLAIGYLLLRLGRQTGGSLWRATEDRPTARGFTIIGALLLSAALAWAWWPRPDTYRPITPEDRGTLADLTNPLLLAESPTLAAPARPAPTLTTTPLLTEGSQGETTAVWDTDRPLPTKQEPALALVLVPGDSAGVRSGLPPAADDTTTTPTWVFPFDEPLAPGPGDNQALAVNTTDGTVEYDVAVALVWVEDDEHALNTNEAYAFASCQDCGAVAISYQVVLVVGDGLGLAPQNLSGAVNYDCVNCMTYALAQQLFVTLDGPLSEEAMAELEALWAEIEAWAEQIEDMPLDQVDDMLDQWTEEILAIIEADQPGTIPTSPPPADEPAPTTDPTAPAEEPTPTTEPAPEPTSEPTAPAPSTEPSSEPTSPAPTSESTTEPTPEPTSGTTTEPSPSPTG